MRPNPWKCYPGCFIRYKNCLPSWPPGFTPSVLVGFVLLIIQFSVLVFHAYFQPVSCVPEVADVVGLSILNYSLPFYPSLNFSALKYHSLKTDVLNIDLLRSFILTYHNIPHSLLLVCFLVMLKLFGTMYICFVFESHFNVEKWTRSIFKVVIWSREIFSKKLLTISTKFWTVIDICYFVVYMSLLCTIIFVMSFFTFNVIFLVCRFSR